MFSFVLYVHMLHIDWRTSEHVKRSAVFSLYKITGTCILFTTIIHRNFRIRDKSTRNRASATAGTPQNAVPRRPSAQVSRSMHLIQSEAGQGTIARTPYLSRYKSNMPCFEMKILMMPQKVRVFCRCPLRVNLVLS
jgi:hypothetical protein